MIKKRPLRQDKGMKRHTHYLICLAVLLLASSTGLAQLSLSGELNSSLYSRQNDEQDQKTDFYQGVAFKLKYDKIQGLYLKTFFQVADGREQAGWSEKVYNGYLNYNSVDGRFRVRLGRQFLYSGVLRGTLDGLTVNYAPTARLKIRAALGAAAPDSRKLEVRNFNDNTAAGLYAAYNQSAALNVHLSYFQRATNGNIGWQQGALVLSGNILRPLFYLAEVEYNLKQSELQRVRTQLDYTWGAWNVFAEFSSAKPRIFEESFFTRFKMDGYQQGLLGVRYHFNDYQVGLQYMLTDYAAGDQGRQLILSADSRWGSLGLLYQDGSAGENKGLFGALHYAPWQGLMLFARSSYYKYQHHLIIESEEATAFAAGSEFKFGSSLAVRGEIQQRINSFYKNDWRGLISLRYRFGN